MQRFPVDPFRFEHPLHAMLVVLVYTMQLLLVKAALYVLAGVIAQIVERFHVGASIEPDERLLGPTRQVGNPLRKTRRTLLMRTRSRIIYLYVFVNAVGRCFFTSYIRYRITGSSSLRTSAGRIFCYGDTSCCCRERATGAHLGSTLCSPP